MTFDDHIKSALFHLNEAANYDHNHLLYERDTNWTERVLASASCRAAVQLITDKKTTVRIEYNEAWCDGLPSE